MAQDDLSAELQKYFQAIEEEYDIIANSDEDDPAAVLDVVRRNVRPRLLEVMNAMVDLSLDSSASESPRITAARFIYTFYFGKDPKGTEKDPVQNLLEALQAE